MISDLACGKIPEVWNLEKGYCDDHGVDDWSKYIYFGSYRKAEVKDSRPVHEIIYPHSKLMIVDDYHVIIGSSNINDRSMLGIRDSEVAIHAESQQYAISLRPGVHEPKPLGPWNLGNGSNGQ